MKSVLIPGAAARCCVWLLPLCLGGPLRASEAVPCAGSAVRVSVASSSRTDTACEGARRAQVFMARLGVAVDVPLHVELVPALPPHMGDAVGMTWLDSGRIAVLDWPAFLARRWWFGVPVSPPLHMAVVAHEVAHGLLRHHLGPRRLSRALQEYVAYVAMFESLAPAQREALLVAVPGRGLWFDGEIRDARYWDDPLRFAADAYRHWREQTEPFERLRRRLAQAARPAP